MRYLIAFLSIIFFTAGVALAELPVLQKEPYRMVQVIPQGEDYHYDGADLIRYPSYRLYTTEGALVLRVPESINNPHIVKILPGTYKVEFKINGKTQTALLEVDSDSFQRFRLKPMD